MMDAPTLNKPKTMKINGQFTRPSLDNQDYYRYRKRMVKAGEGLGNEETHDQDIARGVEEICQCNMRNIPGNII